MPLKLKSRLLENNKISNQSRENLINYLPGTKVYKANSKHIVKNLIGIVSYVDFNVLEIRSKRPIITFSPYIHNMKVLATSDDKTIVGVKWVEVSVE